VKTGFRSALGGYQSRCGVKPDLSVFGKAVANGYPLGVIGGRGEVMALFDDPEAARRVLIAGTYNAHPIPTAAAIATIDRLRRDDGAVYRELEARGARLQQGLEALFSERGLTAIVSRLGSAFCTYFMDHVPVDWHDLASHHDFDLDRRYRRALLERGVFHFPLPCKQGSISAAHSDEDLALTLDVTREALKLL
jgi:glutamate-1-semialdehyde 2,1-aminomutase